MLIKIFMLLLWGQPAQGPSISGPITFRTTYPSKSLPFNEWIWEVNNALK